MLGIARGVSNGNIRLKSTTEITDLGEQFYTVPAGTLYVEVEMWGAGGGGGLGLKLDGKRGGSSTYQEGSGGGGGGYVQHKYYITNILANDTLNFTIGQGGTGADLDGTNECKGENGGDTWIRTHARGVTVITNFAGITAAGGCGGDTGNILCIGSGICYSEGGTGSGGNMTNENGEAGTDHASVGGSPSNGKAGGAAGNGGAGGAGGDYTGSGSGGNGTAPGGGGGGGASSNTVGVGLEEGGDGGNGANGKVRIKAYGIG